LTSGGAINRWILELRVGHSKSNFSGIGMGLMAGDGQAAFRVWDWLWFIFVFLGFGHATQLIEKSTQFLFIKV
jgi:hypothetical protein